MATLFVMLSLYFHDFYKVPLLVIFIVASAYGLCLLTGRTVNERIRVFSGGAADSNLLLMVWIFVLAGAFAASAKAMGAVDATVQFTLSLVPANMLPVGIFIASCFVSLSIGTSVGTVVAIVPVAAGLAQSAGMSVPLLTAACVGGAFFGDNLSFISDTTVVATRTQGCLMRDKFKVNLWLALPAAIISIAIYVALGTGTAQELQSESTQLWKIIPYLFVIIAALSGMNVMLVLSLGILLTGITGWATGSFALDGWLTSISEGIGQMGELILISMLAGGLLAIVRQLGGIDWLLQILTRRVSQRRGAEYCIAALVSVTNLCTANNTVAILTVGEMARNIARRFGVDPRKSASILDTFSCCVQGCLPYGAQLLMASGLAGISPTAIMPWLIYPALLGGVSLVAIFLNFPRLKPTTANHNAG